MMQLVYKIDSAYDKSGNSVLTQERRMKRFHIVSILEGRGAILSNVDNQEETLQTSKVEKVFIFGNKINIVTANTEYWLAPLVEGV